MEENNMHVANLELCKELYELSGWEDTEKWYMETNNGGEWVVGYRHSRPKNKTLPAYELGYLLRKLPVKVVNSYSYLHLSPGDYGDWNAFYINEEMDDAEPVIAESADTPEDTACKLAIELFKQGVLTKLEIAGSDE